MIELTELKIAIIGRYFSLNYKPYEVKHLYNFNDLLGT